MFRTIIFVGKFKKEKRKRFYDENKTDEEIFEGNQKMKCEVFLVIIDQVIINLHERKLAYIELHTNFGFLL